MGERSLFGSEGIWRRQLKFEIDFNPSSDAFSARTSGGFVVDKYVDQHGTRAVAEAYPQLICTPTRVKEIAAKNFYRPRNAALLAKYQEPVSRHSAFYHYRCGWAVERSPAQALRRSRHLPSDFISHKASTSRKPFMSPAPAAQRYSRLRPSPWDTRCLISV